MMIITVIIIIIGILIIGVGIVFALTIDSIQFHAVHGTSMTPEYQPGDLVVAIKDEPNFAFDSLRNGDVIVFETHDPEFQPPHNSNATIHRIMGSYIEPDTGIKSLITKGDNNAIAEPLLDYPIYEEDVIGKVVFKIPWIAYPKVALQNFNTTDTLPTQQKMEEAFGR